MHKNESYIELNVKGMNCTNCALGIQRYLEKEGLAEVSVNFSTEEVSFVLGNGQTLPSIVQGIERMGYQVGQEEEEEQGFAPIEKLFAVCLVFTLPLLLHMLIPLDILQNDIFQLALATPVYILGMYHFGRSGWQSLKTGVPNMDVLIAMGATAAYFYSLYGSIMQLGHDYLFYETAASIITIVLLGNVMEHRSVRQTTTALRELTNLQKGTAKRVHQHGDHEHLDTIPIERVQVGDILLVNEGDAIPVDGVLMAGNGSVDESMISGESIPVEKVEQSQLIGGTILLQGNLRMQAQAVGKQSVLGKIIQLVKQAQNEKPAIQKLADQVSAIFVPSVLSISLLTFGLSYFLFGLSFQLAIIHSVAVLVVACPCAMGLATPTAVMVGIGRASKNGILIKGGTTLEQFAKIQKVVFDKTGTLTTGKFEIANIHYEAIAKSEAKQVLYNLEQYSSHPIAQSIHRALEGTPKIPMTDVREIKGIGIQGRANGSLYQLGSYRIAQGLTTDDQHHVYMLKDGQLVAWVDLKDEIKEDATALIQFLKDRNIEPILLSGDSQHRCEAVAQQIGIEQVYAEKLPEEKLAIIESLKAEAPTAMVGDGINDALALTKADVGISLGNATQIAIQSAQIILLNGKLATLSEMWKIGTHTVRTIKQNLFWAFFYNVVAIPAAAIGMLTPIVAAFAMAFSDVIVIGNSLWLKRKRLT